MAFSDAFPRLFLLLGELDGIWFSRNSNEQRITTPQPLLGRWKVSVGFIKQWKLTTLVQYGPNPAASAQAAVPMHWVKRKDSSPFPLRI